MNQEKLQAARDAISAEFEAAVAPIQKKYEEDMAAAEAEYGQSDTSEEEGLDSGDMMELSSDNVATLELHGDLPSDEDTEK